MFQGSFKCVSRWRGVPRDLENFKGASQVSKRSSRQFRRHLKEVLGFFSVFKKISKKVSMVFQECFNEVFFAILFLQGSHRSYPSRKGLFRLSRGSVFLHVFPHNSNFMWQSAKIVIACSLYLVNEIKFLFIHFIFFH